MKTQKITNPAAHGMRIIVIPQEKLTIFYRDITVLEDDDGNKYEVKTSFVFHKSEPFPGALMLLATGQNVEREKVWQKYRRSAHLYYFVVEKIN